MNSNEKWAYEIWDNITRKINHTSKRIDGSFPHISKDGKYDNNELDWWTNGFWPGLLWLIYNDTRNETLKNIAEFCEEMLGFDRRSESRAQRCSAPTSPSRLSI